MTLLFRAGCVVGLLLLLTVVPVSAQGKAKKALEEPTRLDVVDTPLQDVMEFLGDQHDIKVEFAAAVKAADREVPITCMSKKGERLREFLDAVLRPRKLGFTADGDKLVVGPVVEPKKP
jgi:hypothetical protein